MPFDWREYLSLSQSLQGQAGVGFSAEASARAGVSRAYYSAFLIARNYARQVWNYQDPTTDQHTALRLYFETKGQQYVTLAKKLRRMSQWRTDADYEDNVQNVALIHGNAIQSAKKVLTQLGHHPLV